MPPPSRQGEGIKSFFAQQKGAAPLREKPGNGGIGHAKPAGEGAKGGHDDSARIGHKTGPGNAARPRGRCGLGVEMTGDLRRCLARKRAWDMAEGNRPLAPFLKRRTG